MLKNRNMKTKKTKIKNIFLLIILIICIVSVVSIFGRYVATGMYTSFLKSKEFYFYSDKLKENMPYYQIDNWSGVDDYIITINMNSRENNIEVSNYDISYDIAFTCSSGAIGELSKTEGIISGNTNMDYFNLKITPNTQLNVGDRIYVTITANSTSYYKKALQATFVLLVGKAQLSYAITDTVGQPYFDLNLTNTITYYTIAEPFLNYTVGQNIENEVYLQLSDENKAKCYSAWVTVAFDPQEIILDMTNHNYINATNTGYREYNGTNYMNEISFKMDAVSSEYVRFYKLDITRNYTYPIVNESPIVTVTSR